MRQIGTKSARYFRQIVTFVLTFAMILTSLAVSSTDAEAAKKVKKVQIGVKVGGSGILVLKKGQKKKLNVSVTPKKASKKVSYKSSDKKVVSVNKKGVVKALKSKGSAKITVTSKQNAKKKATITVKIGTPVSKVAFNKTAEMNWSSANFELVEKNGQIQKVYPKYSEKVTMTNGAFNVVAGRSVTLKATVSPKKATSSKIKWSADKGGKYVALVPSGKKCVVSVKKVDKVSSYKVKITATAMDGSGKKATVTLNVGEFESDKTPAPTKAPDTRNLTKVEDFESYAVGTVWDKYTAAGMDQGHITVVQDPENPDNKCLEVKYDGSSSSYDLAPALSVDISKLSDSTGKSAEGKTLGNYTGINADLRIVGDDSDVTYKTIYCYFDQYGAIQKTDKFAANANKTASAHVDKDGNAVAAGDANEDKSLRFGVEISHATGSDTAYSGTLYNGKTGAEEKDKYMPSYAASVWKMEDKSTWFIDKSATTGYKPSESASAYQDGVVPKVGFASKSLIMDHTRIKEMDSTLLDQTKFDVVIGSTYKGAATYLTLQPPTSVTLYIDNITLAEEVTEITDFAISTEGEARVGVGGVLQVNTTYTPENTTQKGLTWTTNNDKAVIDASGKLVIEDDFAFDGEELEKKIVVTATSVAKPELTKSIEVTVYRSAEKAQDIVFTAEQLSDMIDSDLTEVKVETPVIESGETETVQVLDARFTKNNQRVFFKLPENIDLSSYARIEIMGWVPGQTCFETWDESFDKTADSWWETKSVGTYPFYEGSHSYRPDSDITVEDFAKLHPEFDITTLPADRLTSDGLSIIGGSPIGPNDIEVAQVDIAKNYKSDTSKTRYISIGTNATINAFGQLDEDGNFESEEDAAKYEYHYYYYSIRLVTKETAKAEDAAKEAAQNALLGK